MEMYWTLNCFRIKMSRNPFITVILLSWILITGSSGHGYLTTKSVMQMADDYEGDKNSMLAITNKDDENTYEDFYDEVDNEIKISSTNRDSMDIIFFGDPMSFLRIDAESMMHILSHTKDHLIPRNRAILAWDLLTDGKTAAFLQHREYLAMGTLLNVIPEEDLYYVNFGDTSVRKYFARQDVKLSPRKMGILVTAYRRYYGNDWWQNSSSITELGYMLCGFPVSDLQLIKPEVLKDIGWALWKRIHRCTRDQLQALYNIASHKNAYGVPYHWTSNEIAKLSTLLTCIPNSLISTIDLEAVPAIDAEVMKNMDQEKLTYFTRQQILKMNPKARRIFILRMQLRTSLDMTQLTKKRSSVIGPSIILVLSVFCVNISASYRRVQLSHFN